MQISVITLEDWNQSTFNKMLSFKQKLDLIQSYIYFFYDNENFKAYMDSTSDKQKSLISSLINIEYKVFYLQSNRTTTQDVIDSTLNSIKDKLKYIFKNTSLPFQIGHLYKIGPYESISFTVYPSLSNHIICRCITSDSVFYKWVRNPSLLNSSISGYTIENLLKAIS